MGNTTTFVVITLTSAAVFFIAAIQNNRQKRLMEKSQNESRELVAEATILSIAATMAAPHLTKDLSPDEAETVVRMWIPVARNIVMKS